MVRITIQSEKIANTVITMLAVLLISIGLTGLLMIITNLAFTSLDKFIDQLNYYYITRGLPISLIGYKITKKYYNNKERFKQWLPLH